ncbi:hypothetical protein TELCIR_07896 [Teladorsagia circumcincta]|uniref:Uncharacterized protein n=1 Tax=Teladorsagia circumcincta TaxID=45464 RepID=A0A2G9UJ26_TELCI|nr:hypothetical protein TELCIR_07896 [Teladorsagia circumcincta]
MKNLIGTIKSHSGFSFTSQKPQENEYDTVPDYMEKEKMSDFGSSVSDYGSYHHVHQPTKMTSSTGSSGTHSSGSQLSSPPSTNKVITVLFTGGLPQSVILSSIRLSISIFGDIFKTNYPTSGRVSALHVTPSPSDSGIVDYETLIRDKENELRVVRNTMEQNEEIIVKCFQLERELAQMKMEMEKPRECDECRQRHSGPLSRRTQDSSDGSLRGEVASLRDEVATLKEALTAQMQVFTDERKKWEREARSESNQVSIGRDRLI